MLYLKNKIRYPSPHEGKLKEVAFQVEGLRSRRPAVGALEEDSQSPPPPSPVGGPGGPGVSLTPVRSELDPKSAQLLSAGETGDWGSGTRDF